jgi:glycerophosphoryl diester phosphodiesterase
LAPENTLAAFRHGASFGYTMFECDVKLSADGVPFLLHDASLQRTTNSRGIAGNLNFGELAQLDAGSWHSRSFAGEAIASFENIARYCLNNGFFLNVEIKPTPDTDRPTGEIVAAYAQHLWASASVPPLLTSFKTEALEGAAKSAPQLPRGLLIDSLMDGWLDKAKSLGCVAVVLDHALWNLDTVAAAQSAGLRTLSYTVNDDWAARRLLALGTDGIITDRVDLFSPAI